MAITILSKPYGSTLKVSPVFNGLSFVISSDKSSRNNFRYICDIYDGTSKIASVKHNPDLATKYGIFDIGQIFENTFPIASSHLFSYGTGMQNALPALCRNYSVRFGEEYSRQGLITGVGSSGGTVRFYTAQPHNLRVGDQVFVTLGTGTLTSYAGYKTVNAITTTSFTVGTTYIGANFTGSFIEGEAFYDNYGWYDAAGNFMVGFVIPNSRPTRLVVGDQVFVHQDAGAVYPGYDGQWIVQGLQTVTISGTQYTLIKTNCPVIGSTPPNGGYISSQSNYKFTDVTTTTIDNSFAFNGAIQYRDFPTWTQNTYILDGTSKKFLTNSPRTLNIKTSDYHTLSLFAKGDSTVPFDRYRYTWYPKSNPAIGTVLTPFGGYARITIAGDVRSSFKSGDNVTLFDSVTNYSTTITSVTYNTGSGSTTIVTSLAINIPLVTGSINLVSRYFEQTYPIGTYWAGQKRVDLQVGLPLQANYFTNFPIQPLDHYTVQAYLGSTPKSEIFRFNIDNECVNWTTYRFVWLNNLGGWDYYTFKGKPLEETLIKKSEYTRRQNSFHSSNNKWNYSVGDRGSRTYNVNANDIVTTTSGILSYDTAKWLMDIYESPEVFIMEGTNLIPINILNDDVFKPQMNKKGLKNLEVKFKYSFNKVIQRG